MSTTNEPTTAQVDAALAFYNKDKWVNIADTEQHNHAVILAAEVRRLRELFERALKTAELACDERDALRAKLATAVTEIRYEFETQRRAREIAKRFLPIIDVFGDVQGVPTIADIVKSMGKQLADAQRQIGMDSVRFREMQDAGLALESKLAALVSAGDAMHSVLKRNAEKLDWHAVNGLVFGWQSAKTGAQVPDAAKPNDYTELFAEILSVIEAYSVGRVVTYSSRLTPFIPKLRAAMGGAGK